MSKIAELKRENDNYFMPIIQRHYGGAPKVKMARSKFEKELRCALAYGTLNVCQTLLDAHQKDPYNSVDELRGDLQLLLVESHKQIKKELNLKIPGFELDNALRKYEGAQ